MKADAEGTVVGNTSGTEAAEDTPVFEQPQPNAAQNSEAPHTGVVVNPLAPGTLGMSKTPNSSGSDPLPPAHHPAIPKTEPSQTPSPTPPTKDDRPKLDPRFFGKAEFVRTIYVTEVSSPKFGKKPEPVRETKPENDLPPGCTKRAAGRFHLWGCCVVPDKWWKALLGALFLVTFTVIFLVSVVPRHEIYSYVIPSVFSGASLVCMICCSTIDPGIIPPQTLALKPKNAVVVRIRNGEVMCKVCDTCNILRPPRSTHCQFCDVCVEEFDHHCGVLGMCVGRRTYRFFCGFAYTGCVTALYILARSIAALVLMDFSANQQTNGGRWQIAAPILCIVAALFGCFYVVPLTGLYVYMSCINTTQKEKLRETPQCCVPNELYNNGHVNNFFKRHCGPLPESAITHDYYV